MENKICQLCKGMNITGGKYCNTCYGYLRKHPEGVYPLPNIGEVHYAKNGDVICHICGQAHRRLGSHIINKHNMSQKEYRDKYKLYHNTKLSNKDYISVMRDYNKNNENIVVNNNLISKGKNTRLNLDRNKILSKRKFQYKIKESYY